MGGRLANNCESGDSKDTLRLLHTALAYRVALIMVLRVGQYAGAAVLPAAHPPCPKDTALGAASCLADHQFAKADFKKLPELLRDPIAVIASRSQRNASVVVLVEAKSINGKQGMAAVYINGYGRQNAEEIDSYAISTVHGRKNAISLLQEAVQDEWNGDISVFYWNKNKVSTLHGQGLQLPRGLQGKPYVHSIRDKGGTAIALHRARAPLRHPAADGSHQCR